MADLHRKSMTGQYYSSFTNNIDQFNHSTLFVFYLNDVKYYIKHVWVGFFLCCAFENKSLIITS